MARSRTRAAVRKATAAAVDARRRASAPQVIADGVRAVAVDLEHIVAPGSLWWMAPHAYVAEQASLRVCRMAQLAPERGDDVALYLCAAMNEWFVTLVEKFDIEHFEAWIAAQRLQSGAG